MKLHIYKLYLYNKTLVLDEVMQAPLAGKTESQLESQAILSLSLAFEI